MEHDTVKTRFVTSVENLEVYKLAYRLALDVHKLSLEFPRSEQYELASQMRRASKSICANLAEGFAKQGQSSAEFKRFISLAIGSAGEMQIWLNFCRDLGYLAAAQVSERKDLYDKIVRMLQNLRNSR